MTPITIPRGAVLANARKQIAEYRASDAWLQDAVPFSHDLQLSSENRKQAIELFHEMFEGKRLCKIAQKETDFELLVANLLINRNRPVMVYLNQNKWKMDRYKRGSYFIVELIKLFNYFGYIKIKKGFYTETRKRVTRIWATRNLTERLPFVPQEISFIPIELVILKDSSGNLKDYRDTEKTCRIRNILLRANKVNNHSEIRYKNQMLSTALFAIFHDSFSLYGRLHTRGAWHYQGLTSKERKRITINTSPVVELDFSGLHPRLLYAKEGEQFSDDPYSIVDNRPEARPFLKAILLRLLNAKDFDTAEQAANYWLYKNDEERGILKTLGINRAGPFVEAFIEKHKTIAKYFCKGKTAGLKIMNLDSRIALDVIDHFSKREIPILAIHDSFIVQAFHKEELFQTMTIAYSKHTNGFSCPIK